MLEASGMRIAFVIENQLGHRALLANLKVKISNLPDVHPVWLPLDPYGDSLLERLPRIRDQHALIFGLKARRLLRDGAAGGKLDAYFMHTQRMAHFAVDRMRQVPTFLSIDATPYELDAFYRGINNLPSQRGSTYWKLRDAIHRRTYAAARGIVTMSNAVATTLTSIYGVHPDNVLVLWPGVDTDTWCPHAVRAPGEECRILFVGADFERKGGKMLLQWAKSTPRNDFKLDIVTEQAIEPVPRVRVHTKFTPNQPGLVSLVQNADLLVLPTQADMSPWVISEAKAAGCAVISTQVGAIPELVRDGIDGWITKPGDYAAFAERLDAALNDRTKLVEFGRRARADAVIRFDAGKNAQKLIQFMRARI
jgi:glycosyltransferase involved in cell wall biosynthesis